MYWVMYPLDLKTLPSENKFSLSGRFTILCPEEGGNPSESDSNPLTVRVPEAYRPVKKILLVVNESRYGVMFFSPPNAFMKFALRLSTLIKTTLYLDSGFGYVISLSIVFGSLPVNLLLPFDRSCLTILKASCSGRVL